MRYIDPMTNINLIGTFEVARYLGKSVSQVNRMVSAAIDDCAYRGLTLSEADTALNVRVRSVFKHAIAWRFVGLSCHVPAQVRGSTFLKGWYCGIEPWLEKIFRKEM